MDKTIDLGEDLLFNLEYLIIFKVYKFNYKYKITENTSRIEVVVKEINSVSEDKISYLVGYNR